MKYLFTSFVVYALLSMPTYAHKHAFNHKHSTTSLGAKIIFNYGDGSGGMAIQYAGNTKNERYHL